MKNIVIVVISYSLFLISCRKVDDVVLFNSGNMQFGKVTAKLNKQNWASSANASIEKDEKHIAVSSVTYFDEKMDYRTEIFVLNVPKKVGNFKNFIPNSNERKADEIVVLYNVMEDDVPRISFQLDIGKSSNYVEITSIDSTRIRGKFGLTFKSLTNVSGKELIYHFKDGNFDVKIIK
jgi:hypothetical protein